MRSLEEDGVWFLPSDPNKEVPGRLTFSAEESPKLYLLDQLLENRFDERQEGQLRKLIPKKLEYDIINGYLVDGKKVTLCNCYQPFNLKTGIQTSKIFAKYILIGHHFKTLEEIKLKGISLRYKNLEDWINLSNFNISWSTNDERNQVTELNVKQITQEPIELGKLLDFSLVLYDKPSDLQILQIARFFGSIGRKVSLEERKLILIKADGEKNLEDIINVIYLFQDFLIFAFGQMTYPYEIESATLSLEKEIRIPDHLRFSLATGQDFGEQVRVIEEEKEKLVPIEILFHDREVDNVDLKFDSQRILFDFTDVKDQFDTHLNLWEQNSTKLEAILDVYLRLTYIPKRHINDFFLSLAQAVEAFHSLSHSGRHVDKRIYKNVIRKTLEKAVRSMPDSISVEDSDDILDLKEYKKILKDEKLSHLNSFSLRERLEEIISEYYPCLPDNFFASSEDQSQFLKKIRKTRNYLTHLSSEKNEHVASGKDLLDLSKRLKILLEVCLLKQLGFKDDDVKKVITKNRQF